MKVLGILGLNLRSLERTGQLSRFTDAYWPSYATRFDRVHVFSEFPQAETPTCAGRCILVSPRWRIPILLYQFLLPFLHKELRACTLLRVMHMTGVVPALIAKCLWDIPYVATYGYGYSDFVWLSPKPRYLLAMKFLYISLVVRLGTSFAARIIATAPEIVERLRREGKQDKLVYLPNGVDTQSFRPEGSKGASVPLLRCVFVGRLEIQKNLFSLMDALLLLEDVPHIMTIVGDGSLKADLERYSREKRLRTVFCGTVEHKKLPAILCEQHVFLLVSYQEGHPKALLEAMSCGLSCIGSNVPGINSLIAHGETGLLCEPTPTSIAHAIRELWTDTSLRMRVAKNARLSVCQHFDLNALLVKETALLDSIR